MGTIIKHGIIYSNYNLVKNIKYDSFMLKGCNFSFGLYSSYDRLASEAITIMAKKMLISSVPEEVYSIEMMKK